MKDHMQPEPRDSKRLTFFNNKLKRRLLAFTATAFMCSAGAVIATNAYNPKTPPATTTTTTTTTATSAVPAGAKAALPAPLPAAQAIVQGKIPTAVLETHLITITPDHIQPAEMIASKGQFVLLYENRSGQDNVSLQLTSKNAFIHKIDMPLLKSMWAGEFTLPEGTYELRESSHPDWLCTITVR